MKDNRVISALVGGLVGMGLLWLTFASSTVTRSEMVSYVEATTSEQLRILQRDIRTMSILLSDVRERVIRMDTILAGRVSGGE